MVQSLLLGVVRTYAGQNMSIFAYQHFCSVQRGLKLYFSYNRNSTSVFPVCAIVLMSTHIHFLVLATMHCDEKV